jgi:hypothetical protein
MIRCRNYTLIVAIIALLCLYSGFAIKNVDDTLDVKDFGMNKPHLLFHLGTRKPISLNMGYGYWRDNK